MRVLGIITAALLAAVALFALLTLFTQSATRCDFNFRLAEADCVRRGVDPFLVWNESVVLKPYYSNNPNRESIPEGCTRQISVYTPYGYALAIPLSFLSPDIAWWIFSALSFALLGVVVVVCARRLGWLAAVPMLFVAYPLWSNFQVGNYIALMLAAAVCMAACLDMGWNVAAGVCWMLLMVKPQIGLAFAVPLAMRMRIVAGSVAVASCLAWHGFTSFFGMEFPMSEYAFRCLDSLNSTLSLAIAAALCVWLSATKDNVLKGAG